MTTYGEVDEAGTHYTTITYTPYFFVLLANVEPPLP